MNENEQKAIVMGNDREALKRRLLDAKSCLTDYYLKRFKNYKYDFENKRLVAGKLALQWMVRPFPDKPESYRNQQTSRGTVMLIHLEEK